jgi:hypothetical protein
MATTDPTKPVNIELEFGSWPWHVISLQRATLDCSSLFDEVKPAAGDGAKKYKLHHCKSTNILGLKALDPLRTTAAGRYEFLPEKIYVRDCMQEIFNTLVQETNSPGKYCIVFGSPGVGKSVLSFLAALCCAYFIKIPVLFLRKTVIAKMELISVFWIKLNERGELIVDFDRCVGSRHKLILIHNKILQHVYADEIKADKMARPIPGFFRCICDGPCLGDDDHVDSSDLVTSGGYKAPKDAARGEIIALPLSAWTQKEVIQACRHLFDAKVGRAKEIFDVCGGNIRQITAIFEERDNLEGLRDYINEVVNTDGSKEKLRLAYQSTSMSGSDSSIDRLRAMFARRSGSRYTTVQYIGSPYILRLIRSKLSMDDTLTGLQFAKNSGIQSLYGWHFELFGHKIFQRSHERQANTPPHGSGLQIPPTCHPFQIVEGRGTGKESVRQLNTNNVYWTPSTPNFANIDAAIALNGTLYCIQYTVSASHTFNWHTFVVDFLEELAPEFRQSHPNVVVVFVVPSDVTFCKVIFPKSQQSLCLSPGVTCGDGIELAFRKARSAAKGAEDEVKSDDGDTKMEEAEKPKAKDNDADEDDMDDDDDCGEEGFDEEEISPDQSDRLCVRFQWESLAEKFDEEKAPLSFLKEE